MTYILPVAKTLFFCRMLTCLLVMMSVILTAQPQYPADREWPKLMRWRNGAAVQILSDSTGKSCYADWRGQRVGERPAGLKEEKLKYLYVDSSGTPINEKRYDQAYPFNGGLATVSFTFIPDSTDPKRSPGGFYSEFAVINSNGKEVLPMDEIYKVAIGAGLAVVQRPTGLVTNVIEVYDKRGKKLAACSECQAGILNSLDYFYIKPIYSYRPDARVKLVDRKGRVVFEAKGNNIEQIYNLQGQKDHSAITSPLPYFRILDDLSGLYTIVDNQAKLVMDSVSIAYYFYKGYCSIYRNGKAAVVDSNWKQVIPFSGGFSKITIVSSKDRGVYIVRRQNNTSILVDADNKQLLPFVSRNDFNCLAKNGHLLFQGVDEKNHVYTFNLAGDTIIDGREYEIDWTNSAYAPGYFIRSRSTGLLGYKDAAGKTIFPARYDNLFFMMDRSLLFFSPDGTAGYMDTLGHLKFTLSKVLELTSFNKGYAWCKVEVTDPKSFLKSANTYGAGDGIYQVHTLAIDSLGQVVQSETFPPGLTINQANLPPDCSLVSVFYKGLAVIRNDKTNKQGLIDEKVRVVVPVIHDSIWCRIENAEYSWYSGKSRGQQFTRNVALPDIKNGTIKVTLKGVDKIITLPKDK